MNAGAITRNIEAITVKMRKSLDLTLSNFTLTSFFKFLQNTSPNLDSLGILCSSLKSFFNSPGDMVNCSSLSPSLIVHLQVPIFIPYKVVCQFFKHRFFNVC